jgi:hypothetical protein
VIHCEAPFCTVQTGRDLQSHPGPAARHPGEKAGVHLDRVLLQQSAAHVDAGLAQHFEPAPADLRIGVLDRRDHHAHMRFDQRGRARGRAAEMRARLQRHVHVRAVQVVAGAARIQQRLDFSVIGARPLRETLADDAPVAHDHASDTRVRRCVNHRLGGELQGSRHEVVIRVAVHASRFYAVGARARGANKDGAAAPS